MADAPNFKRPARKKNALSEYKLRLYGKKEGSMTREPSLSVSVVKNQVHFDVYTNIPQEKNSGRLTAAMDSRTFYSLLAFMRRYYDGQITSGFRDLQCDGHGWFNNQRSEKKLLSVVRFGADKEGVMFIAVLVKGHQDIKFEFEDPDYHRFLDAAGNPVDRAELSRIYAEGWCMELAKLVAGILVDEYVDPQADKPQGQGNGGGSNNNWGSKPQSNWGGKGKSESWGNKGNSGGGGSPAPSWDEPAPAADDEDFPDNW